MTIVLILMIKNESLIIKRCLDNVINFVDAVFILDTGSEDDTCKIINTLIFENTYGKPMKLLHTPFETFGKTRSKSFTLAKEFIQEECHWNLECSYGLLIDADMIFKLGTFDKNTITDFDEYKIIQRQGGLEYHNTRLIRMSLDWKCVGSTHEYWTCGDEFGHVNNVRIGIFKTCDKMWIDDVSDGGCKSDKLERDEKLLLIDLENSVKTENLFSKQRTLFYLAQTYKCLDQYEKSIDFYLQRIECQGWDEEIWVSYYNIAMLYDALHNKEKAIEYGIKSYEYDRSRAESLHFISKVYLFSEEYDKALEYANMGIDIQKNTKKILSTEVDTYTYGFYELKFVILTKIPSTPTNELLEIGFNMVNRTPDSHYISLLFKSILDQLAITINDDAIEVASEDIKYDELCCKMMGDKSCVLYNLQHTKVYTPVIFNTKYNCIGINENYLIFSDVQKNMYKCQVNLDMFDIK